MTKKLPPFFNTNSIVINPKDNSKFIIKNLIGQGAFAQCYSAYDSKLEEYALKIIDYTKIKSKTLLSKLESEIVIHRQLNHPNIVKMYTNFKDSRYVYIVLELCPFKSLDGYIKKEKAKRECENVFTEKEVRFIMQQIVDALIYLHQEKSVIHRDLKLGNLFLDANLKIKLGDFGLSSFIVGAEKRRTFCGTPNYIAPEIINSKTMGHSYEVDIWAFGVILYVLLVGTPPFQKSEINEIYENIKNAEFTFPKNYVHSRYSKDLIRAILNKDPSRRPTITEIALHPFFTKKENSLERIIRVLSSGGFTVCKRLNDFQHDYVKFTLQVSKISGIGYIFYSGLIGVYFTDISSISLIGRKTIYLKKQIENRQFVYKKSEFDASEKKPGSIDEKNNKLLYFVNLFCNNVVTNNVPWTLIVKIKRINNITLFGFFNGCIQLVFDDDLYVVIGDDGQNILIFRDERCYDMNDALKLKIMDVLKMVK